MASDSHSSTTAAAVAIPADPAPAARGAWIRAFCSRSRYGARMVETAAAGDRFRDEKAVRCIVTEALRGLPVRIFLFGSRARGEARLGADIDVALLSRDPIPRHVLSRLREELEASNILASVDVVDLSEASPALREEVLREGREWTVSDRA